MQWLSLSSAWFLISLLVIIAMYILKKTYLPRQVSSHLLWKYALQESEANRPWQKLKNRLLLWLQLIIALLLILALMQPYLERAATSQQPIVILLDRSASMSLPSEERLIAVQETITDQVKQWLQDKHKDVAVTIVVNGVQPEVLVSNESDTNTLLSIVEQLELDYGDSDDSASLSLARAIATASDDAFLHVYTDPYFLISDEDFHAKVNNETWHVTPIAQSVEQLQIMQFHLEKTTESSRAEAYNGFVTFSHPAGITEEELLITGYDAAGKIVYEDKKVLQATDQAFSSLKLSLLPQAVYYKVQIEEQGISLSSLEKTAYQLTSTDEAYRALLITEGNLFLEKALQLMDIQYTKADTTMSPPSEEATSFHFVIVDGGDDELKQSEEWAKFLSQYPLWIIEHPASDSEETVKPNSTKAIIKEHAITQYISFADTYISQFQSISASDRSKGEVIVEYGGQPAILAGYQNQQPFVKYLFQLSDSDLPLRAEFPILIMQTVMYMLEGTKQQLGQYISGDEMIVSLHPKTVRTAWKDWTSDALRSTFSDVTEASSERMLVPNHPGVYQLVEENNEQVVVQNRFVIVNADQKEWLQPNIQLIDFLHAAPANVGAAYEQTNEAEDIMPYSLLPWIILFISLFLILEWEVYRRGL